MTLSFHDGDLLESGVTIIGHQVNCQAVMGAGIAKTIRNTWPRVFGQYKLFCKKARMDLHSPLGSCQLVWTDDDHTRIVANLFGQEYYGRGKKQTDYDALRHALHELATNKWVVKNAFSIGFPYLMGSALGGGDWDTVLAIIKDEFRDYPGEIQIWKL